MSEKQTHLVGESEAYIREANARVSSAPENADSQLYNTHQSVKQSIEQRNHPGLRLLLENSTKRMKGQARVKYQQNWLKPWSKISNLVKQIGERTTWQTGEKCVREKH